MVTLPVSGGRKQRFLNLPEFVHRKALIDLLNKAQPIIEQTQSLYREAEPLIDEAMKEWQTVGPAAQILIDVISHQVNEGSSPADAAEVVRAALNGSIKTVAQDDWEMSRITVFGGTGFVGRHIVRHLCEFGTTVRIASRQPRRPEGANVLNRDTRSACSKLSHPISYIRLRRAHCALLSTADVPARAGRAKSAL